MFPSDLFFNHLKSRFAQILVAMMSILILSGCTDEIDYHVDGDWESGLPAKIKLSVAVPEREVFSRGELTAGLDNKVDALWIGIYNADNGQRTGDLFLTGLNTAATVHNKLTAELATLSGRSRIVAIANYENRFATTDRESKPRPVADVLKEADTWEKYCNISITFDANGSFNVEAPLNPLVMEGVYTEDAHNDGSQTEMTIFNVKPGESKPAGAIHLRRLISRVKFNVTFNSKNISSFAINSYRFVNIPRQSWAHERLDDDELINASDDRDVVGLGYGSTGEFIQVDQSNGVYSFDCWLLENKRTGREWVTKYTDREKEFKNGDGSNSGKFESLVDRIDSADPNNNASYAVFHVTMAMNVDEEGNQLIDKDIQRRLVEVDYLVHFGYLNNDARDFNCRRNSLYTYNVTINNVNDLVVEAKVDGQEQNPGTSGFVSDVTNRFLELDAHFGAFNIELTQDNIDNFQYMLQVPTMDGRSLFINSQDPESVPDYTDPDFIYLNWIELRYSGNDQAKLAEYKPISDGDTYLLPQIYRNRNLTPGWYTVFVNEYVYESPNDGDESGSANWQKYVNKGDRRVWFNVAASVSKDFETVHYKSKYALSQSSIQSFYNASAKNGFGSEHTNETLGVNLRNTYNPGNGGQYRKSGRYNIWNYINNVKNSTDWASFVDQTSPQLVHEVNNQNIYRPERTATGTEIAPPLALPCVKTTGPQDGSGNALTEQLLRLDPDQTANPYYIEIVTACLNRNRDLNGDGKIDKEELRWFVPTEAQMTFLILGQASLRNPIFQFKGSRLPSNKGDDNGLDSSLLFATSDGRMLWIMEGMSTSNWRQFGNCAAPWEVRCIRNLGEDNTIIDQNHTDPKPAVQRDGQNIIDMSYYDILSIREEAYYSSDLPMPVHHLNDLRYNRCYKSFEYADSLTSLSDPRTGIVGNIDWDSFLATNNPCKYLVDKTGKNGWRVPNQAELALLSTLGIVGSGMPPGGKQQYVLSNTYTYFDKDGYALGANPADPAGSITSQRRFELKLQVNDGHMTQADNITNKAFPDNYFLVRCVRDVIE